jgi:hypothetical protein
VAVHVEIDLGDDDTSTDFTHELTPSTPDLSTYMVQPLWHASSISQMYAVPMSVNTSSKPLPAQKDNW